MEIFEISGGRPLYGSAVTQGSKNSVLPILAASLLGGGSEISNCPDLSDVDTALRILRRLGCDAQFKNGIVTVSASKMPPRNDSGNLSQHSYFLPAQILLPLFVYYCALLGVFSRVTIEESL